MELAIIACAGIAAVAHIVGKLVEQSKWTLIAKLLADAQRGWHEEP